MMQQKKDMLIDMISAFLLLLFLYTAVTKLYDYHAFRYILSQSPLIRQWAYVLSWVLPCIEIIIAVLLFIKGTRPAGLYTSLFLLIIFTVYLIYTVIFLNASMPCSCGGAVSRLSWKQHILFNLLFISITIVGIRLFKQDKKASPNSPP